MKPNRRTFLKGIGCSVGGLVAATGVGAADTSFDYIKSETIGNYSSDEWLSVDIGVFGEYNVTQSQIEDMHMHVKHMMDTVVNGHGYLNGVWLESAETDLDVNSSATRSDLREAMLSDTYYQKFAGLWYMGETDDIDDKVGATSTVPCDGTSHPGLYEPFTDKSVDEKQDIPVAWTHDQADDGWNGFMHGVHELGHLLIDQDSVNARTNWNIDSEHDVGTALARDCGYFCTNHYKTPMTNQGAAHKREPCKNDVSGDGLTHNTGQCEARAMEETARYQKNNC